MLSATCCLRLSFGSSDAEPDAGVGRGEAADVGNANCWCDGNAEDDEGAGGVEGAEIEVVGGVGASEEGGPRLATRSGAVGENVDDEGMGNVAGAREGSARG